MEEIEFKHLQKLAKIGKRTSSLFHELNNYFSIISGNLELIEYFHKSIDPQIKERLDKIQNSLGKAILLVQTTLTEVRKNKVSASSTELNTIINNSIDLIKANNQFQDIQIIITLTPEPYSIFFNVDDFQRVLINLLKNAAEAITSKKKNGAIELITRCSKNHLILEITNNGPCIPVELHKKLFTPFFTTKPKNGNGLGLSICKEVIEGFDGKITFDKTYEGGTKFIIKLLLQKSYK